MKKTFEAIKKANQTLNSDQRKDLVALFESLLSEEATNIEEFKARFGDESEKILNEAFPEVVSALNTALQQKRPNPQAANVFFGVLAAFDKDFNAGVDPISAYRFAWTSNGVQLEKLGQAYLQRHQENPQLKAISGVLVNPAEHDPYVIKQVVSFIQEYSAQIGRKFKGAQSQQQPNPAAPQQKPSMMQQVNRAAPAAAPAGGPAPAPAA